MNEILTPSHLFLGRRLLTNDSSDTTTAEINVDSLNGTKRLTFLSVLSALLLNVIFRDFKANI